MLINVCYDKYKHFIPTETSELQLRITVKGYIMVTHKLHCDIKDLSFMCNEYFNIRIYNMYLL